MAATRGRGHRRARLEDGPSEWRACHLLEEVKPSSVCRAARPRKLLADREIGARLLRRAVHRQDPHPRAIPQTRCRFAGGRERAGERGRAVRSARAARSLNHPGDPPPLLPKPPAGSVMLILECHRLAIAALSPENWDRGTPRRSTGRRSGPMTARQTSPGRFARTSCGDWANHRQISAERARVCRRLGPRRDARATGRAARPRRDHQRRVPSREDTGHEQWGLTTWEHRRDPTDRLGPRPLR